MYNKDGSVRPRAQTQTGPKSSLNLSWESEEEGGKQNVGSQQSGSQLPAGMKTNITTLAGAEQPVKSRPGAAERHLANQGSLRFSDSGEAELDKQPPHHRGVSDAKKKALYESNVFASDTVEAQPTSHVISENKKKEYSGNDIFHKSDIPEELKKSVLGGVKKAPGGGGSLTMQNLHALTPVKP